MDPIMRREVEQWKRRRADEKGTERHGCPDDKNEEIRTVTVLHKRKKKQKVSH
jgi:hypothetical protein